MPSRWWIVILSKINKTEAVPAVKRTVTFNESVCTGIVVLFGVIFIVMLIIDGHCASKGYYNNDRL